jgi:hypothetical protein
MIHSVTFSAGDAFMAVGLSEGFAVYTTSPLSRIVCCACGGLATSWAVAFPRLSIAVFLRDSGPDIVFRLQCLYLRLGKQQADPESPIPRPDSEDRRR